MRKNSIIASGANEAYRGNIARVRAEVEQEFAATLKGATILERARARLRIRLEIARRMKRYASSRNLYSQILPGAWLAWPMVACGLAAMGCQSVPELPVAHSSPASHVLPALHASGDMRASGGVIEGRILDGGGAPIADARVSLFREGFFPGLNGCWSMECIVLDRAGFQAFATTQSTADGCYQFEQLQEGPYTVRVTASGFAWREVEVAVGETWNSPWSDR